MNRNKIKTLDISKIKQQVTHIYDVLEWIKAVAYNQKKIKKVEQGIDTDIYDIDVLQAKRQKLLDDTELSEFLPLAEKKSRLIELHDLMGVHSAIAFDQKKTDEVRLKSAHLMEDLNNEYKALTAEYEKAVLEIEPEFRNQFEKLYQMIIDGTDIITIKNALNTFQRMQDGRISMNQALNAGIDYEEARGAPEGLLDCMLPCPRVKNGGKSKSKSKSRKKN